MTSNISLKSIIVEVLPGMGDAIVEPILKYVSDTLRLKNLLASETFNVKEFDQLLRQESVLDTLTRLEVAPLEHLVQIVNNPAFSDPERLLALALLARFPYDLRAIVQLCSKIGGEDSRLNLIATYFLKQCHSETVAFELGKILREKDLRRRIDAVNILGDLEGKVASDYLEEAKHDPNSAVRSIADYKLSLRASPKNTFSIRQLVNDPGAYAERIVWIPVGSFRYPIIREDDEYWNDSEDNLNINSADIKMSLQEHFDELRERLLRTWWACLILFGIIMFIYSIFGIPLLQWGFKPLRLEPTFLRQIWVSISVTVSFILVSFYFFYEIWRFLIPALTSRENRQLVSFTVAVLLIMFVIIGITFEASKYILWQVKAYIDSSLYIYITTRIVVLAWALMIAYTIKVAFWRLRNNLNIYDSLLFLGIAYLEPFMQFFVGKSEINGLKYRVESSRNFAISNGEYTNKVAVTLCSIIILTLILPVSVSVVVVFFGTLTVSCFLNQTLSLSLLNMWRGIQEIWQDIRTGIQNTTDFSFQGYNDQGGAPIGAHFFEARHRLTLVCALALGISIGLFLFKEYIVIGVMHLYGISSRQMSELISFTLYLKIFVNLLLVSSYLLVVWQVWLYLKPALTKGEQVYGRLVVSILGFLPFLIFILIGFWSRIVDSLDSDPSIVIALSHKLSLLSTFVIIALLILYIGRLLNISFIKEGTLIVFTILTLIVLVWPQWFISLLLVSCINAITMYFYKLSWHIRIQP